MAALLGTVALPAPVVPKEKAPAPAQRLRKELDKSIDFETTDQPLDLALDQLREQTKINFVLDRQTLAQMNIDPNQTPIKVKLKEARVKTVLRTILGAHNLGYAIIGDTVFVSSDEMTMFRQMQQRVNLDVEKVEFAAALRQLSRETATNLIIDSRVAKEANQTVSLQVEDVPLETAVRLLAEMVGLKPVRVGNVLFVCTKAHAQELRADPDLAPRPVNPYAPLKIFWSRAHRLPWCRPGSCQRPYRCRLRRRCRRHRPRSPLTRKKKSSIESRYARCTQRGAQAPLLFSRTDNPRRFGPAGETPGTVAGRTRCLK